MGRGSFQITAPVGHCSALIVAQFRGARAALGIVKDMRVIAVNSM
jgi:hypothetical protein